MHENLSCPFSCVDNILKQYKLGTNATSILVDIHAEATSEKTALGHYLDGRVSAVVGTHTHVPTADARIFTGGTAYQTDTGMCGDYNSVIGMEKSAPIKRFLTKINKNNKMTAASGEATICGIIIKTNDKTGLAEEIETIIKGGSLG
jgi:calcineurin-like phosphoesterase